MYRNRDILRYSKQQNISRRFCSKPHEHQESPPWSYEWKYLIFTTTWFHLPTRVILIWKKQKEPQTKNCTPCTNVFAPVFTHNILKEYAYLEDNVERQVFRNDRSEFRWLLPYTVFSTFCFIIHSVHRYFFVPSFLLILFFSWKNHQNS